jgi:LEA14-like dessication related protein
MSKGKKIALAVLVLIIILIIFLATNYMRSGKNGAELLLPELKIASIQILDLDSEKAVANMQMQLDNPLIGIHVDSLYYTMYIEGKEVIRSTYPAPFDLPSDSNAVLSLPITIYYDKLIPLLETLEKKGIDSVTYKVTTVAYTNYLLKKKMVIETERYLPLIKIPKIAIENIRVHKLGVSNTAVSISIALYNPNVFAFGFKDMNYKVRINEDNTIEGNMPESVWAPARDTTKFTIQSDIDLKDAAENIVDYLLKPAKSSYTIRSEMKIISKHEMIENSKMILTASGTLKEIKEIQKDSKEEKKTKENSKRTL